MAFFRYQNWSQEGNQSAQVQGLASTNKVQASFPGATISVFDHGTTNLSTLYQDSAGSLPLANPFTANADGSFGFYAAAAHYDVVLSGTVNPAFTISDVVLTEASAGGGGGGVSSVGLSAPNNEFTVSGSPVTAAGTLGLSWKNQNKNLFFSGPASGSAATPTFRAIDQHDVPVVKEITVFRGVVQINSLEEFLRIKIPQQPDGSNIQYQFAANFAGSTAVTLTTAAGSTTFNVYQDTGSGLSLVGTVTWGIGSSTGALATTGGAPITFNSGDILVVRGPNVPDATLSGWGIVLVANKVVL